MNKMGRPCYNVAFNESAFARRGKAYTHPTRWLKVCPATGAVLGEFSSVAKPSAKFDGAIVVSAVRR